MIHIDWNPVAHLGLVPINCHGLGPAGPFLTGRSLVRRWALTYDLPRERVEAVLTWVLFGAFVGARLYYVAQNEPMFHLTHPRHIIAVWEGGLAFFGGLFGAIAAAYIYARRARLNFARHADLFAPAIPIAAAVGRIPCGLDRMDDGTPSRLPWAVGYVNPDSFAPTDGLSRHPDQFYEFLGDLAIAAVLLKLRGRLRDGELFLTYLVLFSVFRFWLFFVRGNVPVVALGLKNGQWTALAILAFALPWLLRTRTARPLSGVTAAWPRNSRNRLRCSLNPLDTVLRYSVHTVSGSCHVDQ
jgi:phosphatidylglycerol:prolipoprotein diacylglycerol transferase